MFSQDVPSDRFALNGLTLGMLATLAWILFAGFLVQERHGVPPIAEYKGMAANVAACQVGTVRQINQCLDARYASLLADWRSDAAVMVAMPPMLGWSLALLFCLWREASRFRYAFFRQRA